MPEARHRPHPFARLPLLLAACGFAVPLLGCARPTAAPPTPRAPRTVAWLPTPGESLLDRHAPIFVTEDAHESWNRIGTPSARRDEDGEETIYVDPEVPTIYRRQLSFEAGGHRYTNLLYRVHFEGSPFTWIPFNAGAGKNVGLFAVITLDAAERPVWVTTVHTCGCYHAILPTDRLPHAAWPADWDPEGIDVYGERLPGVLRWSEAGDRARVVVRLRGGSHRVMDVGVASASAIAEAHATRRANVRPIADLDALPLGEGTTSFFHEDGRKRGLVKGAWKPLETLLFGAWIRDFHVGRDRRYGPRDQTQLFYTTLNPLRKERSDMWDFAHFLELEGWKTGIVAPAGFEAAGSREAGQPSDAAVGRGSRM
ncbi:MAG: hypothetical protein HKP30_06420 [Myxococcales bacterium]|nr:hypothetical protein [Myxococcales bacterium]